MEDRLFSDFKPVTREKWIDRMARDLKGTPYEKLIWKSPEGIPIEPAYTPENLPEAKYTESMPGEFPFVRGYKSRYSWLVRQDITVDNPEEANLQAKQALQGGAESLAFVYPDRPEHCIGMNGLLTDIDLADIPVFLENNFHPYFLFTGLKDAGRDAGIPFEKLKGAIAFDPLGFFTVHGDYPSTEGDTMAWEKDIIEEARKDFPGLKTLAVHANIFNHAGGNAVQEIGYTLAAGNEYLTYYTKAGIPVDMVAQHIFFHFATSSDYFMEVAKFRAFRMLWSGIVRAYKPAEKKSPVTFIHSETALRNQTLYDPYVNILRATTEGMSAILGGVDSLTIHPYDNVFRSFYESSSNIARNIQLILKYESHFDKITDPAAGAYYIENLTHQLAGKAWDIFQDIEKEGGYRKALQKKIIQRSLKKSLNQRLENIATRKEILVGTNHYPNHKEKVLSTGQVNNMRFIHTSGAKQIEPVHIERFSEKFEDLRLATELSGKTPLFYLFSFGAPAIRFARENFVANLLGCAGFNVAEHPVYLTPEENITAINNLKPDITVLCGEDDLYPEFVEKLNGKLTCTTLLAVAGYPEAMVEKLSRKGVRFFLHQKANALETLQSIKKALNI